jgi:hypothetical protein
MMSRMPETSPRTSSPVDDDALRARVRELRAKGSPPKAIARTLGLRPSDVAHLVRELASEAEAGSPSEPELAGCWVSPGWSSGLGFDRRPEWPDQAGFLPPDGSDPGLAVLVSVLVARRDRRKRLSVCGYLVDTGCLGVKNVIGPKNVADRRLPDFVRSYFQAYEDDPMPIPLELAQQLVYGAEAYARGLGFEPHPDYAAAKGHLGEWSGRSVITFGRHGKPYYFQGPYDDAAAVLRTLDKSVGAGKYEYVLVAEPTYLLG